MVPRVRLARACLACVQRPYGPFEDPRRYTSNYVFGEDRYSVDLGRDPQFFQKRLEELVGTGFINPLKTRTVRIRFLAYNDALAMLCMVAIEADLSPTGVIRTRTSTSSFPAQEYMQHSYVQQLTIEGILVVWTTAQLAKELFDLFGRMCCGMGSVLAYFSDPFKFLDSVRFCLFFTAITMRALMLLDTSRDVMLTTGEYVDTENVQILYNTFDLITAYLTICSLMSTIQYFACVASPGLSSFTSAARFSHSLVRVTMGRLTERTSMLKGTLAKTMMAMSTFIPVFLIFFLCYCVSGMVLLGSGLESFSDMAQTIHTSFEMMNANIPLEELLDGVEDTPAAILSVCFYCAPLDAPWRAVPQ